MSSIEHPEPIPNERFALKRLRNQLDDLFIIYAEYVQKETPSKAFQRLDIDFENGDAGSVQLTRLHPSLSVESTGSSGFLGTVYVDADERQLFHIFHDGELAPGTRSRPISLKRIFQSVEHFPNGLLTDATDDDFESAFGLVREIKASRPEWA